MQFSLKFRSVYKQALYNELVVKNHADNSKNLRLNDGAHRVDRRALSCALVLGAILAASAYAMLYCVGFRDMESLQSIENKGPFLALVSLAVFLGVSALSYLAVRIVPFAHAKLQDGNAPRWLCLKWDKRSVLQCTLIILLLWVPWIVLQYPCGMGNDTYEQLYEFQTSYPTYYYTLDIMLDASYVDHHPVFDTLVFGAFVMLGELIGSQNIGLFAYSLVQAIFTAFVFAVSCCYLQRLNCPKPIRIVAMLFFALFALFGQYATSMVKDSLFSAVFVLFFILYIEAFATKGAAFKNFYFLCGFVALGCLCALTKKTGSAVVLVSVVMLLVYCRCARWRVLASLVLVFAIYCIAVPLCVYPLIGGVADGGRQEAFGIPVQQVVTVANEHDDLSESERCAVEAVFDLELAQTQIAHGCVDMVKSTAYYDASAADYLRFMQAYVTIGARHPDTYLYAMFDVVAPLVCPGTALGYYGTPNQQRWRIQPILDNDVTGELHLDFSKPRALSRVSSKVQSACNAFYSSYFGIFAFGVGTFGGWIPLFAIVMSMSCGKRWGVAFAPLTVSVLLLLICPASATRYVLPMIYTLPLFLGLFWHAASCSNATIKQQD